MAQGNQGNYAPIELKSGADFDSQKIKQNAQGPQQIQLNENYGSRTQ